VRHDWAQFADDEGHRIGPQVAPKRNTRCSIFLCDEEYRVFEQLHAWSVPMVTACRRLTFELLRQRVSRQLGEQLLDDVHAYLGRPV